jgi:hypothetical protein
MNTDTKPPRENIAETIARYQKLSAEHERRRTHRPLQ